MHDMRNDFRVALHSGDYEQAERLANNQLALLGESSLWLNEMGMLLLAQGRYAEALLHFDRAAAADSNNIEAILNGSIVLADLGFYDEAASRFDAARAIEGNSGTEPPAREFSLAQGHTTTNTLAQKTLEIAKIYKQLGELVRAEEEIRKSISIHESAAAFIELARLHLAKNEGERALDTLENARRIEPMNAEIHVVAAQCHLMKDRRNEALDSLSRAELLDDKSQTGSVLRRAIRSATNS